MNVSELAKAVGLSASGVRWYERIGVLRTATRHANGYREYTDEDRRLMQLVATLRHIGLSPAESGRMAGMLLRGERGGMEIEHKLTEHRDAIRKQRSDLQRLDIEIEDLERTIAETSRAGGDSSQRPISVLFLCNANSGRSQMGEAMLAKLGGGAFEAVSAGIAPRPVSGKAVAALASEGIDWSSARSKSVHEFQDRRFDYVISLSDSARDECPVLPGPHNSLHWNLADPGAATGTEEERQAAYQATIEELRQRLQPFCELARVAREQKAGT